MCFANLNQPLIYSDQTAQDTIHNFNKIHLEGYKYRDHGDGIGEVVGGDVDNRDGNNRFVELREVSGPGTGGIQGGVSVVRGHMAGCGLDT